MFKVISPLYSFICNHYCSSFVDWVISKTLLHFTCDQYFHFLFRLWQIKQTIHGGHDMHLQAAPLMVNEEAAEAYLIVLSEDANLCAIHAWGDHHATWYAAGQEDPWRMLLLRWDGLCACEELMCQPVIQVDKVVHEPYCNLELLLEEV